MGSNTQIATKNKPDSDHLLPSLLENGYLTINESWTVGMLPTRDYRVDELTVTSQIDKVLRDERDLPGVIIHRQNRVIGIISRRDFYEILGRRYGVAVFLNRPIQMMLEMIETDTVIVPSSNNIPETVTLALERSRDQIYEPILIEFSPSDYRLLDVYTLLLAQTQLFDRLRRELQDINNELEQRVARRTEELLAANQHLEQEINDRRRAEQRLETRLSYEQALTKCANALLTGGDTQGVTLETLAYLQKAVGVSRVFMVDNVDLEDTGPSLRLRHQVCASGVSPIPQKLSSLPHTALGDWLDRLWSAQWVIGQSDETLDRESKLMQDLGFTSILLLPIGEAGNWQGLIGFGETQKKRFWDEGDIQLMQTIAQMLFAYLERRRNAEILAEARDEALRASQFKSELLAKVSHELRTPLGAILGYAQLLSFGSYGQITDEQKDATSLIISSTKYLNSLVNGLLDQAQIESGRIRLQADVFDIREMVATIDTRMRILVQNKGLDFKVEIEPQTPRQFTGDRMRIEQVLINLLGNAIKFTEDGLVRLKVDSDQEYLRLQVTDTGSGIPESEQRRIFEPFVQVDGSTTRRFSGTGLGLSISQQLVQMMSGQISLHSQVENGTTFTVALPFVQPASDIAQEEQKSKVEIDAIIENTSPVEESPE